MPSNARLVALRPKDKEIICERCGRPLPRLRTPIPDDLVLTWPDMQWMERRLMAGLYLDHIRPGGRGQYADWKLKDMGLTCLMTFRQASNAVRRLVICRWLQRVSRGVYRLTPGAVEQLRRHVPPNTAITRYRPRTSKGYRRPTS